MNAKYSRPALIGVVCYAAASMVAILAIGVWATWHPGSSNDGVEYKVINTWILLGMVPTFLGAFLVWAHGEVRDR